ncbi:MAG: preprotein translocase subunit SecE [Alphaproteobacteria bacterium]|nr:preprotein translocase subunit SecE [Alphaproteobacteria bacterium]
MAKTSPAQFIRQVRQEISKVTWPSRKETGITTVMVFVMVAIASIFLMTVDMIFAELVQLVLQLGGS